MTAKKPTTTYTAEIMQSLRDEASAESRKITRANDHQKPTRIDQKIRRQQIENDIAEADQRLKVKTLFILFGFLSVETIVVFMLAFFQGLQTYGFHMEEWSFRIVIGATIGQITAMLTIAVQHLFPKKERH
ncbi:MAG TPA: hypothetical protein VIM53_03190 [Candidatus Saccharimonadales bacterium]